MVIMFFCMKNATLQRLYLVPDFFKLTQHKICVCIWYTWALILFFTFSPSGGEKHFLTFSQMFSVSKKGKLGIFICYHHFRIVFWEYLVLLTQIQNFLIPSLISFPLTSHSGHFNPSPPLSFHHNHFHLLHYLAELPLYSRSSSPINCSFCKGTKAHLPSQRRGKGRKTFLMVCGGIDRGKPFRA